MNCDWACIRSPWRNGVVDARWENCKSNLAVAAPRGYRADPAPPYNESRDTPAPGWTTALTYSRRTEPSGNGHSIDWPAERPRSAVPTGASTDTRPAAASACDGYTSTTSRSAPVRSST